MRSHTCDGVFPRRMEGGHDGYPESVFAHAAKGELPARKEGRRESGGIKHMGSGPICGNRGVRSEARPETALSLASMGEGNRNVDGDGLDFVVSHGPWISCRMPREDR